MINPWIKVLGAKNVLNAFEKRFGEYADNLEAAATAGALVLENAARDKAPYKTGTLKRSLTHETIEKSPDAAYVAVGTNLEYAAVQEFGGTIKSKSGYLVFQTEDGQWHSVPSVSVPARPYLRPALDENRGRIVDEVKRVLKGL
jgi:HK97 gp10 family phage protein